MSNAKHLSDPIWILMSVLVAGLCVRSNDLASSSVDVQRLFIKIRALFLLHRRGANGPNATRNHENGRSKDLTYSFDPFSRICCTGVA